jgi:hypothetical protein
VAGLRYDQNLRARETPGSDAEPRGPAPTVAAEGDALDPTFDQLGDPDLRSRPLLRQRNEAGSNA